MAYKFNAQKPILVQVPKSKRAAQNTSVCRGLITAASENFKIEAASLVTVAATEIAAKDTVT